MGDYDYVSIRHQVSDLGAPQESPDESQLVGVVEVAPHREPGGEPGDTKTVGLELTGYVHRGGVSLDGRWRR